MTQTDPCLRNLWYFALPSSTLRRGGMVGKILLGEPLLFGRNARGEVFALRDICPHRAMPLSCGSFDGEEVTCCYHGWRFSVGGVCTAIPSLTGHEEVDPNKIKVRRYDVNEAQGCIWVFMASASSPRHPLPLPPTIPVFGDDAKPFLTEVVRFPCSIDHAVVGLMDPAHGPFVHASWWWRSGRSIHEKAKAFAPSPYGFTMLRHSPSTNSFAYKILGGKPATEIAFQLPGIRTEHIHVGRHHVVNLTCVTPLDDATTEVTNSLYSTSTWVPWLKPLIRVFARRFLEQDRAAVVKQQTGLRYEQNLLLLRDADTQARWYYQLKNEWIRAEEEKRAFINPVKATTLRWRS